MASPSFRESISSLGWSRRDEVEPVTTTRQSGLLSSIQSLNPFKDGGYVQLPTTESSGAPLPAPNRREEEEGWLVLSRWDRLMIFGACNLAALACFVICFALFPVLSLRPTKFVILWTLGSIFFLASFAAVMGPMAYARHLLSAERLPFTSAYLGSLGLSLYFALGLRSTILTLVSAIVQLACLVWYLISYFPMGSTGLRFATSLGARRAATWMTV
ncbi:SFT2-domain-containing protein [Sodiomyces alkalinus F11]|uniref:Protein transport protein SFT2 n=1 Tax=Sodiomyces alkalinus (strain CBS 110278 / VKM F-3762 / F11) TaxID=1314773 RepID=A0A3N2PR84_SODAK|nr:SFT2-domain-containing protein [Sodiomyces alkalinus F11]ROT37007.1 SFT2-domain-containing protein [Sodiomyces alkalinus F11]